MPVAESYLDPQTLASVGSLQLRARMIVEGIMNGQHRSPYQGFSIEFAQHRQYAPGDDIRHLDWKVFGRTDKLYLKQYQQETNLEMVIALDRSGSMNFSSDPGKTKTNWRKYDYGAALAVALSYLALQQQDRAGLQLFDEHVRDATRQSNTHEHWRSIVEILSHQAFGNTTEPDEAIGHGTDLNRVFEEILARQQQRSLIVLISDLFDDLDMLQQALAKAAHRRFDVIVLQILDPAEITFPYRSMADFVGLEGQGKITVHPTAIRKAYLEAFNEHLTQVQNITRKFRFDYLKMNTAQPLGPALSHFLARRNASVARQAARR